MTSNAEFKIRNITTGGAWSLFADGGFDADYDDVLELQLEDQPALDANTAAFTTLRTSKDAPDIAYDDDGVPSPAAAALQVTLPSSVADMYAHSWIVQSQTNGGSGVLVNGRPDYTINTAERMICIRSPSGLRKIIAVESTQYSPTGGWADAQNEEIDGVALAISTLNRGPIPFVAGTQSTTESTPVSIAVRPFNASAYTTTNRTITLHAWLEADSGATATLELYNVTDVATVATLTTTEVAGELKSVVVTLPAANKVFEVRLSRSGGTVADSVYCKTAYLEVTYP
jgi:hypothetical protein